MAADSCQQQGASRAAATSLEPSFIGRLTDSTTLYSPPLAAFE